MMSLYTPCTTLLLLGLLSPQIPPSVVATIYRVVVVCGSSTQGQAPNTSYGLVISDPLLFSVLLGDGFLLREMRLQNAWILAKNEIGALFLLVP